MATKRIRGRGRVAKVPAAVRGKPVPPEQQARRVREMLLDCSADHNDRFVATNKYFAGTRDPTKPTGPGNQPRPDEMIKHPATGKEYEPYKGRNSIWRNPVYYCKSPYNNSKLGFSLRNFKEMSEDEMVDFLVRLDDPNKLWTVYNRAKARLSRAVKVNDKNRIAEYREMMDNTAKAIEEYRKIKAAEDAKRRKNPGRQPPSRPRSPDIEDIEI